MSNNSKPLYYFIDGFEPTGESTYDIWKQAGNEGGPAEFLEFMRTANVPTKTSELTNDSGYVVLDDNGTNKEKTWSSSKIKNEVDAVAEKLGGTVEITSNNPSKANTVMTIDPSAEEINVYSVDEVDDITDELADKADDMQRQINVERARINTFTALGEGSTTGDAELVDARIDKDGNTHANVGEHIRTVTQELSDDLSYLMEKKVSNNLYNPDNKMDGNQLYSNGTVAPNPEFNFTGYIDVEGYENITIYFNSAVQDATEQFAFYKEDKTPNTAREYKPFGKNDITLEVPTGSKYFGMAYMVEHWVEDSFLMIQSGSEYTGYKPYGEKEIIVLSSDETKKARGEYKTLGDRLDAITTPSEQKKLVYWGDSLTEGNQAGDGGCIPITMQNLLGESWTVINFGRGGDLANNIACRQGGMCYVVKPNQTIPASGSVELDITDNINSANVGVRIYTNAVENYESLNPCYIGNIKGELMRVSSDYEVNKAIFTREDNGDAVVINRPTSVITNAENYKNLPVIISIGQNGGFNTSNPTELLNIVRWMVKHANTDKFIVMGLYHTRGLNYTWQSACNDLLKAEFGRKFIDAEEYMKTKIYDEESVISTYALNDMNLTPSSSDLEDISADKFPRQIMHDEIHFNRYGYECIAKLQHKRGKELGYW